MNKLLAPILVACLVVGLLPIALAQAPPADGPERLIVLFDALPPGLRANDHYNGAEVLAVDETLGFAVVQASHGRAYRAETAGRDGVRGVEADTVVEALGFTPSDPRFASQYAPQLIGAPAAWTTTKGAPSVSIYMLDTGVRTTHQDLRTNYAGGIDLVNDDNDPWDDGGHGTRTAGVATATLNNGVGIAGIANVPLKEVKVLNSAGSGYNSDIASGIRWSADNGARVVSMSFGSTTPNTAVRDAIDYAWGKGVLLVAGSGNSGGTDSVLYPAAFPNVIAVGSVDANRAVSSTSSRGSQLDLAAPRVNVLTTGQAADSDYRTGGGTSIAAPHVAGVAALVWSAHPTWTNQQVRTALLATAQDLGAPGWDSATGNGLVRADLAVAYGSGTGTTMPTSATTTSSGSFQATVTPSASSNEWWVQVGVSPAPAKVEVKAGSEPYVALDKQAYGYAKGLHVAKGTMVQFRVTSMAGQTATTPVQAWLVDMSAKTATTSSSSATTTTTTTTTTPAFTASFTPKSVGNDWWVETAVSANAPVTKVEAKVGAGAWTALPATDWGTYAKSLGAPNGSVVTFKATNAAGATVTSANVIWT